MNNQTTQLNRIDPTKTTVGEVVADNYDTAGIFREYGVDFCCGGGITLEKACEKKGIDADELVSRLVEVSRKSATSGENFKAWQIDYLIDHIIDKHHGYVRRKVEEINAYAQKVAHVHGRTWPENVEIAEVFQSLSGHMLQHLEDEEQIVFPLIQKVHEARMKGQEIPSETIQKLRDELDRMVEDHEGAGDAMARINELSNGYSAPDGACTTYRILYANLKAYEQDLHEHVHLENNILFKKAEKLI